VRTAQQMRDAWVQSSGKATTNYNEGVQSTQKDQAQLAVNAIPRMVAGFNAAANEGRIAAGLTRGGTPYWKARTQAKSPNYSAGFAAGGDNFGAAAQKLIPALQNGVAQLPPRGDIEQNIQRSRALALYLHSLKGTLGAR
jgi:transcription elongation factor